MVAHKSPLDFCCSYSHMDTIHIVPSVEAVYERDLETFVPLPIHSNLAGVSIIIQRSFSASLTFSFYLVYSAMYNLNMRLYLRPIHIFSFLHLSQSESKSNT